MSRETSRAEPSIDPDGAASVAPVVEPRAELVVEAPGVPEVDTPGCPVADAPDVGLQSPRPHDHRPDLRATAGGA